MQQAFSIRGVASGTLFEPHLAFVGEL